ncbi:serine protease, S1-C subfamily, contains C-terminal PDZ domain [Thermus arciformis]|uniref:Serine protease, S1-C subfamily, contains C-terminal PDZ domain n=1 Tax=Thermus arciformis TaxID=482827 RepID=A0A1G7DLA3_9DEIN|nr:S1C family serine protease [Thermus arciformis]SDE52334.1 serine protease, S1-C subfamily, contains C-terminal PDZ domain [Thermus arciformis]
MRPLKALFPLLPLGLALYALLTRGSPVLWAEPVQAGPGALQEAYTRAHPAVLGVADGEGTRGTGFFYREGLVLTAYHVVAEGGPFRLVLADRTQAEARVVGFAEPLDLAVLATPAKAPALLPLETARRPKTGEPVLHIGNGRGQFLAPRYGRVTGLEANPSAFLPQGLVETSLPLAPGDSGGPVLDAEGRVLGVAVAIGQTEEGFRSFFTPLFGRGEALAALERGERRYWPYLGLRGPRALTAELARELGLPPGGVVVGEVVPGGSAHRAGLRGVESGGVPDVILEVDGVPVNSFEDLLREVRRHQVGERIRLTVRRESRVFQVEAVLAPFPGR